MNTSTYLLDLGSTQVGLRHREHAVAEQRNGWHLAEIIDPNHPALDAVALTMEAGTEGGVSVFSTMPRFGRMWAGRAAANPLGGNVEGSSAVESRWAFDREPHWVSIPAGGTVNLTPGPDGQLPVAMAFGAEEAAARESFRNAQTGALRHSPPAREGLG